MTPRPLHSSLPCAANLPPGIRSLLYSLGLHGSFGLRMDETRARALNNGGRRRRGSAVLLTWLRRKSW